MNICMCGYQPGAAGHEPYCPYPLFRGTQQQEDQWMAAFHAARAKHMSEQKRFRVVRTVDSWTVVDTTTDKVVLEVDVWRKNVADADCDARNEARA